jgi:hypothetical protein
MEYQSQSQWNEVYQGHYLTNQPTMLEEGLQVVVLSIF